MIKTLLLPFVFVFYLQAQDVSVTGRWVTVDDASGLEKSEVLLYVKNDKLYGKIQKLLLTEDQGAKCTKCKGKEKDQPIAGLLIINGLEQKGSAWTSGDILDPKSGKRYRCVIKLEDKNTLLVRGYLGIAAFGRTQTWKRKS